MGSFSIWHWLIVLVIILLVFGTKKLRSLGSDLGGAVKGFKEGVKDGSSSAAASTAGADAHSGAASPVHGSGAPMGTHHAPSHPGVAPAGGLHGAAPQATHVPGGQGSIRTIDVEVRERT